MRGRNAVPVGVGFTEISVDLEDFLGFGAAFRETVSAKLKLFNINNINKSVQCDIL